MNDSNGTNGISYFANVGQDRPIQDGTEAYDRQHGNYGNVLVEKGRARASTAPGSSQQKRFTLTGS